MKCGQLLDWLGTKMAAVFSDIIVVTSSPVLYGPSVKEESYHQYLASRPGMKTKFKKT